MGVGKSRFAILWEIVYYCIINYCFFTYITTVSLLLFIPVYIYAHQSYICTSRISLHWSFQVSVCRSMTNSIGIYVFHKCKTLLCVYFIIKEAYRGCISQEKLGTLWPCQHKGDSCMLSCAF